MSSDKDSSNIYKNNKEINHFFRRNDSITLDQIKNFIAIYELGSFSKAAEATHKTQPSISHNLSKLEEKLSTQLVKRNRGKAVSFTEEGHRFYHDIAPLIDKLLIKLDESESKNAITIGVTDDLDMDIQLELFEKISAVSDNRLRFMCAFSNDISTMIEKGRISFGIIKRPAKNGALQYAWAANRKISFDEYDKLPLVLGLSGCMIRDLAEKTLNQSGKDFFLVYLGTRLQNRTKAIAKGFGIGIFSKKRLAETPELVELDESLGFPPLTNFEYHLIGETDTAEKNKIHPILLDCVQRLNQ